MAVCTRFEPLYAIAWFIRNANVSISNAFAYFSILKLVYAMLK